MRGPRSLKFWFSICEVAWWWTFCTSLVTLLACDHVWTHLEHGSFVFIHPFSLPMRDICKSLKVKKFLEDLGFFLLKQKHGVPSTWNLTPFLPVCLRRSCKLMCLRDSVIEAASQGSQWVAILFTEYTLVLHGLYIMYIFVINYKITLMLAQFNE